MRKQWQLSGQKGPARRRWSRRRVGQLAAAFGVNAGVLLLGGCGSRQGGAHPLVKDILAFKLESQGFLGTGLGSAPVGAVTFRLHEGLFNGAAVWFVRTDASDQAFAQSEGLVFVPALQQALQVPASLSAVYLFAQGTPDQHPVFSTAPGRADFTPLLRVHQVAFTGTPTRLASAEQIQAATQEGRVRVTPTEVVVNFPLVAWPGGSLPPGGTTVEKIDTARGQVTFRLFQAFPESRYIITDVSLPQVAEKMSVAASPAIQTLRQSPAVARVVIFLNGLRGPGIAGFQPSVFSGVPGESHYSPLWLHFAARWKEPRQAQVVRSFAELDRLVQSGELELFNGLPDTHPQHFIVNCPTVILAPNTYEGE